MAKTLDNSVYDSGIDGGLQNLGVSGDLDLHICSAQPTTYTEATSTYSLGSKSSITVTGPVDGDTSGRKVTVDAITGGDVTANGDADFVAIVDTDASVLKAVVEITGGGPTVVLGQNFSVTAFKIEMADPT
jgi:hypothetical protein